MANCNWCGGVHLDCCCTSGCCQSSCDCCCECCCESIIPECETNVCECGCCPSVPTPVMGTAWTSERCGTYCCCRCGR